MPLRPQTTLTALAWLSLLSLGLGCRDEAQIKRYQVPHEPGFRVTSSQRPPASTSQGSDTNLAEVTEPQRMLAAIIPRGDKAWFFKALGPVDQIQTIADDFRQILSEVSFDESSGTPRWSLPDGWQELQGNGFRFATLKMGDVEVSVSSLALPPGQELDSYLLLNVNRWRNQVGLAPVDPGGLSETSEAMQIADQDAVVVDLVGQGSAGAAPTNVATTNASAPTSTDTSTGESTDAPTDASTDASSSPGGAASAGRQTAGGWSFVVPDSWKPGRAGAMRTAAFEVQQDGEVAEITVIALGPAAGSLLDNVNRWRGQINLPPLDEAGLASATQSWDIAGTSAPFVKLVDESGEAGQAILAVTLPQSSSTLFIKMMGPEQIVQAEEANFESFAKSFEQAP